MEKCDKEEEERRRVAMQEAERLKAQSQENDVCSENTSGSSGLVVVKEDETNDVHSSEHISEPPSLMIIEEGDKEKDI